MREEWRTVQSLPFVMASSLGRIRVGPYPQRMPYGGTKIVLGKPRYGVCGDGPKDRYATMIKRKNYKVARLVCEAFHGPAPAGRSYCLHRDEDQRNNKPDNLYWGTQKENLNAPGFIAYCKGRTGENSPTIKARRRS